MRDRPDQDVPAGSEEPSRQGEAERLPSVESVTSALARLLQATLPSDPRRRTRSEHGGREPRRKP